jgi:acetyl-CoA carboxylase carboxyl transferase subunit alpha
MSLNFLDFEQPIAELDAKIEELQLVNNGQDLDLDLEEQITQLREKNNELTNKIFSNLDPWQTARVARHPQRPYTLDYISHVFTEFDELAGDRAYADDRAIVGGTARLDGKPVMVIGHQ